MEMAKWWLKVGGVCALLCTLSAALGVRFGAKWTAKEIENFMMGGGK